jgi:hypothetical protein
VLAGLVLVTAAACNSSSTSNGGSAVPTVNPNDPNSIISAVAESQIKSFHIKVAASGTFKSASLSGSSVAGALSGDLKLDGASLEGDVDVTNKAAHLTVSLPAVPIVAFVSVPISGDIIVVDNALYYKFGVTGLPGTKYTKSDLAGLAGRVGISVPAAGSSPITPQSLQSAMAKTGVTPNVVGVEQIGGQDAYRISFLLPLDLINALLGAEVGGASMKIDSMSIDVWVYKNGYRPAKAEFKEGSAAVGDIDLTATISDYDKSVTVTAPAAGDIAQ